MKNVSRTAAAKAGKRKPWYRGKYEATAKKEIAKPEAKVGKYYSTEVCAPLSASRWVCDASAGMPST